MNARRILRRLPHSLWLLVVWVALWGDLSLANVVSGSIVVGVFAWIFTDIGPRPASSIRPVYVVKLIGWFLRSLVVSTWQVARLTLGSQPIEPAIIAFPVGSVSDSIATLIADAISLTPGTLTLDVRSDGHHSILYIHVLDLRDEDMVRSDLTTLRRLAVLAFADSGTIRDTQESS